MDLDRLVQRCARLSILVFHFFAAPGHLRPPGILQLYVVACEVIDLSTSLDAAEDFASYSTSYFMRMVLLAAHCILKITRSSLKDHIDPKQGEEAVFKAIRFVKNRSIQNNDLDARNGIILTQLWSSNNIFKKKDGSDVSLELPLRSRLVSHTS